ncbi:Pyruvate/Phosphoenolpyruvate kinase-like domain-containing protein [Apodospora peruviana]|uniref:Pyruvate/Phosphoenolpyruvate kinase-like domain-containing protein n=1 Tax=Apodospora peruviana TaxID=516989 RepID=A0AAE0M2D3_9PEZI|nr:Pyruvate/Phosphoenolpyruvate kinase-like domain-containing protein [Apodospora peruviana]
MVSTQGMLAYAAPNFFQPHKARQAIRDAHDKKIPPLIFYYAGLSSVPITRFVAPMGFDGVWIDWEHSACGVETMTTMVHEAIAMSGGRTIPFVRIPGHDHAAIGWALDCGASIIVPQVETVEQAKHIVSAAKFGGNGTRSAPPFRYIPGLTDTPAYPGKDFFEGLNDQAAIMIQVETKRGVENLDAILTACPDIDIVWLGSLDCRVSMGLPANMGMGGSEPEYLEVLDLYDRTLTKHNKPRGGFGFASPPWGSADGFKEVAEGKALLTVTADVMHLMAMAQDLRNCRALVSEIGAAEK